MVMWTFFVGDLSGILALAVQKKTVITCDHECDFFLEVWLTLQITLLRSVMSEKCERVI